jgi:pimeloyl-ACP methyl ester carboxylesterase
MTVRPFRFDESQEVDRLRERLMATRWPEPAPVDDWSQGVPLAYLQDLCEYWLHEYSWSDTEQRLNRLGHFVTDIDGVVVHFVHERSPHDDALPLVLTHGWPSCFLEFEQVIDPLRDPERHGRSGRDSFHVVCPSLPGFGFSSRPSEPGWGVDRIARAWQTLMHQLGYRRYGAQGGDWGALVSTRLGQLATEEVVGIHLNMPAIAPDRAHLAEVTAFERAALDDLARYERWDSGYSKQMSTRPQTIGYALVDSPSALLAWIVEKLWAWSDHDGDLEQRIPRQRVIDIAMLYWLPAVGASSSRIYWESFTAPDRQPVAVPTGCSVYPADPLRVSRRWAESRFTDIRYWNEPPSGGHFPALEVPDVFVEEVTEFFRLVR